MWIQFYKTLIKKLSSTHQRRFHINMWHFSLHGSELYALILINIIHRVLNNLPHTFIRIFFLCLHSPWRTLAASHIGGFLRYLDIWYDSLDEWSARRKASTYTGQHNTERRGKTSMPWAGFEPTIPATNRPRPTPQTARPLLPALHTDSGTKCLSNFFHKYFIRIKHFLNGHNIMYLPYPKCQTFVRYRS
jgi:hypothetical protein